LGVHVKYHKTYYARQIVSERIYGNWKGSYNDLLKLLTTLQASNEDSVFNYYFDQTEIEGTYRFKYLFWAFRAAINGFNYSLPVITIDGTHLYGKYKGHLLLAVGMNANREIYPLAYSIVDGENFGSWQWFMTNLVQQVIVPQRTMCIISDRHPGLLQVFRETPQLQDDRIKHRFCLRHLRSNVMRQFKNSTLKKLVYQAGTTPNVMEFQTIMTQIYNLSQGAHAYLSEIPRNMWTLCYDGGYRCGILTTNSSESFNNSLKGCRMLPVAAIVKKTYDKIVEMFATRRTTGMMWLQAGYRFSPKVSDVLRRR
jgi:hypothetical protein